MFELLITGGYMYIYIWIYKLNVTIISLDNPYNYGYRPTFFTSHMKLVDDEDVVGEPSWMSICVLMAENALKFLWGKNMKLNGTFSSMPFARLPEEDFRMAMVGGFFMVQTMVMVGNSHFWMGTEKNPFKECVINSENQKPFELLLKFLSPQLF